MKKIQIENETKSSSNTKKLVGLLVLLLFVLSTLRVIVANRLVETSEHLRQLDKRISQITDENQSLSEQVRQLQSTDEIEKKVKLLGFVKTSHFSFISTNLPVAYGFSSKNTDN